LVILWYSQYVTDESDVADLMYPENAILDDTFAKVVDVNHCGIVEITKELEYKAPA
jgi:hypothetical protein